MGEYRAEDIAISNISGYTEETEEIFEICDIYELSLHRVRSTLRELRWQSKIDTQNDTITFTRKYRNILFTFTVPLHKDTEGKEQYDAITDEIENVLKHYDISAEAYKHLDKTGHGKDGYPVDMEEVYKLAKWKYDKMIQMLTRLRGVGITNNLYHPANRPVMLQIYLEQIGRENDVLRADELLDYAEYIQKLDIRGEWWGWKKADFLYNNYKIQRMCLSKYIGRLMKDLGVTEYKSDKLISKV